MHIAIVTEKPSLARMIAPYARRAFPADTLSFPVVWPVGLYGPALPRGLAWRDYPHIAHFDSKQFGFRRTPTVSDPPVGRLMADGALAFERGILLVENALQQADRLVVLGYSDSLYHVDVARRVACGEGLGPGEVRALCSLDTTAIETALAGQRVGEEAWGQCMVEQGQVRRYFDHQFALNSLAVLGKTLGEATWISKYQLQTLYMLRRMGPLSEWQTHEAMSRWAGSGRYKREGKMKYVGLGSLMSRGLILEQMIDRGWIELTPTLGRSKRLFSVSRHGNRVLENLHPGCEDPDLPFRLCLWAGQGLEESRGAIDRYIRTFFGRQKRFWETRGRVVP